MEHQNWDSVVIRAKPKPVTAQKIIVGKTPGAVSEKKYDGGTNHNTQSINSKKIEAKHDEGDFSVPKVSHDLKMQIQQARVAKKMTQQELATACNLQVAIIKSYENGTALPNSQQLTTISKILGVNLKNKQ